MKLVCHDYAGELSALGLNTLQGVQQMKAELIKNMKGQRDIHRLRLPEGQILFIKRNWKAYTKDGLKSLFSRGRVHSISRREFENLNRLREAGLQTGRPVAYGEVCGFLKERFSFLVTEAAPGEPLDEFLCRETDTRERQRLLMGLADHLKKMHGAGLASPDLFARHVFVRQENGIFQFALIDMARLDQVSRLRGRKRARDLAALNASLGPGAASLRERLLFLSRYEEGGESLLPAILKRTRHLLKQRKFARLWRSKSGAPIPFRRG